MASRGRRNFEIDDFGFSVPFSSRKEEERQREQELLRKIGEYTVADVVKIHETMLEQDALLERLTKAGIMYSRVIDFDDDKPVVSGGLGGIKVEVPDFEVNIGDWVITSAETRQITEKSWRPFLGEVVTISRVVDDRRVEVGNIMGSRLLLYPRDVSIHAGEDWLADQTIGAVIHKVERPQRQEQTDYKPVYWSDIGGLVDVKRELRETIALLRCEDSRYSDYYDVKLPKGCLLWGPPGNGKTMLARAVATELAGDTTQFIYVKGPEILSKFVGVSEEKIRLLFLRARKNYERSGNVSVIVIDECDAIMNARGSGRSSDVERTIVPAFLTEMDGLESSHAFVMLLTNRPDTLDPAIIREGRIDRHVLVGEPDRDAVKSIFEILLSRLPCQEFSDTMAEMATDIIFGHQGVSGAMVEAIVERAKRLALRRDIEAENHSGVSMVDLETAAKAALEKAL